MFRQLSTLTLAISLLLAGCYQKAGVAYQSGDINTQPTASGVTSNDITPLPLDDVTAIPTDSNAVAITIISPSLEPLVQPTVEIVLPTQEIFITPAPTMTQPPNQPTLVISNGNGSGSDAPPLTLIVPTAIPTQSSIVVATVPPTLAPLISTVAASPTTAFVTPNVPVAPPTLNTPVPTLGAPTAVLSSGGAGGLVTPTAFSLTNNTACTYTVQPGDTLFRIAIRNDVDLEALRQANLQIKGDLLHPGDVLTLPACAGASATAVPPTAGVAQATATGTALPAGSQLYTVQPGDTIYAISLRFGVTMKSIIDANKLSNPDRLKLGQQLIIPSGS